MDFGVWLALVLHLSAPTNNSFCLFCICGSFKCHKCRLKYPRFFRDRHLQALSSNGLATVVRLWAAPGRSWFTISICFSSNIAGSKVHWREGFIARVEVGEKIEHRTCYSHTKGHWSLHSRLLRKIQWYLRDIKSSEWALLSVLSFLSLIRAISLFVLTYIHRKKTVLAMTWTFLCLAQNCHWVQ